MRQGIQLLLPPNFRFPLIRTALKGHSTSFSLGGLHDEKRPPPSF
jgi:hypothetical protein